MRRSTVLLGLVASLSLGACADADESSLCPAYGDVLAAVAALPADPSAVNAEQAADAVEEVRASADQLAAADDGRHAVEIAALAVSLDDLERTLRSLDPDAAASTWEPAVEDSTDDVADALVALGDALAVECDDDA